MTIDLALKLIDDACARSHISPCSRIVFLALANLSTEKDECCPSIREISRHASVSVSSVRRSIADLIALGFVERHFRTGSDGGSTSNVYKMLGGLNDDQV